MSTNYKALSSGTSAAKINTVGAALSHLIIDGIEVIPEAGDQVSTFAGVILAPWPNRIAGATYEFDNRAYSLTANDGLGNALHGFVHNRESHVASHLDEKIDLIHLVSESDSYPTTLKIDTSYQLVPDGIEVVQSALNVGQTSGPVGIGTHPYFPADHQTQVSLSVEHAAIHGADMIPIREVPASEIGFGQGAFRSFGDLELDTQFRGNSSVSAVVRYRDYAIEIWSDNADFLMVYTTRDFPWLAGRGSAIAIEPQTCAADAFNTGDGLQILLPGESLTMKWGVRLLRNEVYL